MWGTRWHYINTIVFTSWYVLSLTDGHLWVVSHPTSESIETSYTALLDSENVEIAAEISLITSMQSCYPRNKSFRFHIRHFYFQFNTVWISHVATMSSSDDFSVLKKQAKQRCMRSHRWFTLFAWRVTKYTTFQLKHLSTHLNFWSCQLIAGWTTLKISCAEVHETIRSGHWVVLEKRTVENGAFAPSRSSCSMVELNGVLELVAGGGLGSSWALISTILAVVTGVNYCWLCRHLFLLVLELWYIPINTFQLLTAWEWWGEMAVRLFME